jgi:hypothetical protein
VADIKTWLLREARHSASEHGIDKESTGEWRAYRRIEELESELAEAKADDATRQQAAAWLAVHAELRHLCPDFDSVIGSGKEKALEAIRKLAAISKRPEALQRWIPVGEGLPETGDSVLVYVPGNRHLKVSIDQWRMQREAPVSFSSATIETGMMWDDHEFEEITHWMPMPSLPSMNPRSEP